jgi:aspartyl aminopeptidase
MSDMKILEFLRNAPSPFHAISTTKEKLLAAGFVELYENKPFPVLSRGASFFIVRNYSSIIAFSVGSQVSIPTCPAADGATGDADSSSGFTIIGTHSDSPCLKLKPCSIKKGPVCP